MNGYIGFFKTVNNKVFGVAFGSGVTFATPELTANASEQTVTTKLMFINCEHSAVTFSATGGFITNVSETNGTVTFDVSENASLSPREGKLTVSVGDETTTLTIKQQASTTHYLQLAQTSATLSATSGVLVVDILSAGVDRMVDVIIEGEDWITATTIENDKLYIYYTQNDGITPRNGLVEVSDMDKLYTYISLVQEYSEPIINVTPAHFINESASAHTVQVQYSTLGPVGELTARTTATFLRIALSSEGVYYIGISNNYGGQPREGDLIITDGNVTQTVHFHQLGNEAIIGIDPFLIDITYDGGITESTVHTEGLVGVLTAVTDNEWITPILEGNVLTTIVVENESPSPRHGNVTLTDGHNTASVFVNQSGNTEQSISVAPSSFQVGRRAGSVTATIDTFNVKLSAVTVSVFDGDATLIDSTEIVDDTLTINYNASISDLARSVTLKVEAGTAYTTVTVLQPAYSLTLSPTVDTVNSRSGVVTTTIYYNGEDDLYWTSSDTWIVGRIVQGTVNRGLEITYQKNTTGADRTAHITVSDGTLEAEYELTQLHPTYTLALSPTAETVGNSSGVVTTTIEYTGEDDLYCTSDSPWVVGRIVQGTTSKMLEITYQKNDSVLNRTAHITVTDGTLDAEYELTQLLEEHYVVFEATGEQTLSVASVSNLEYSDNGITWHTMDVPTLDFDEEHPLYIRGMYESGFQGQRFRMLKASSVSVGGNIMSLINYTTLPTIIPSGINFAYLFSGCTQLVSVSEDFLPATTLSEDCYYYMFYNCNRLVTAPVLPATELTKRCYHSMFAGCTSLVTAPDLPATTLADSCYYRMFLGCWRLVTAPALPATTLADLCYYEMFWQCTSLTTAPALPATTLAEECYSSMFGSCTGLTTAPALPATTLATQCYWRMFYGCSGLTTAPALPATTLADWCYYGMFNGCSRLNYIKCLATDISASGCLSNWVSGVSSSGTFVKKSGVNYPSGDSGIPNGWTVVEE